MRPPRLLAALAVVTTLLLVPLPLDQAMRRWPAMVSTLENFAHPIVFAWLANVVFSFLRPRIKSRLAPYALTLALTTSFGLGTEYLQSLVGRDASWVDAGNDVLGTLFALLMMARKDLPGAGRRLLRCGINTGAVVVVVAAAFPLLWITAAYAWRAYAWPVLWRSDAVLMRRLAHWQGGEYPGLVIEEPRGDWRGYSQLWVTARSLRPSGVQITLRVHDHGHNQQYLDRYNEDFVLPGDSQLTLKVPLERIRLAPEKRDMDMGAITGIIIFQETGFQPARFEVTEVLLVP